MKSIFLTVQPLLSVFPLEQRGRFGYGQSNVLLTKELCKKKKWDFDEILNRSKYLAGIAKQIWSFNNI
ncbi:hypothetical protein ACWF7H_23810 [Peribacillus butanolivorans]